MTKLPPKPKKYDNVERTDMSRMFGMIVGFREGYKYVLVKWDDGEKPAVTKELPTDLALTKRVK